MPSARSTSSPRRRCRAIRSRWSMRADGLDDEADAGLRALDQPERDHVPARADRSGGRLPRAHLHARRRAAVRRPSDPRQLPAWLGARRPAAAPADVVQQCEVGLVRLRRDAGRIAFAAPPLRTEPVDAPRWPRCSRRSGWSRSRVAAALWLDNGPALAGAATRRRGRIARARTRPCGAEAAREGRLHRAAPGRRRVRISRSGRSRRPSASPKTRSPAA